MGECLVVDLVAAMHRVWVLVLPLKILHFSCRLDETVVAAAAGLVGGWGRMVGWGGVAYFSATPH